ncbi:hypothetical protein KIW84_074884 [Lathyrus oleraceus]|uniref:Uncharacterized protein n=1 Tax=Pisum sativum TaxID=3888 RepID=A0A9D4VVA7_PEA|nr:hypothetical protein KIW84_074884 [Pisum sativum]
MAKSPFTGKGERANDLLALIHTDFTAGLANTGCIECQIGCCDIHPCQQILRNRTGGVLLELSIYFQSGYQGNTRPGIRPTV